MNPFKALVKLFLVQMRQSKALWVICGVMALAILFNVYTETQFKQWMDDGMTYDLATQKATGALKQLAASIRNYSVIFVFVIAALVAPTSRKNGTSQFVLSLQVSRMKLAIAQFLALSIFITAAVLIIHTGFGIIALRLSYIDLADMLFAWIVLLAPLLMTAAVSFALSLSLSSISVYLVLLGIPLLTFSLVESTYTSRIGKWIPVCFARMVDNIILFFPSPDSLIFWPFLSPKRVIVDPPHPVWSWSLLNYAFVMVFWVSLSFYFYRSLNIGSRQVLK